MLFIILLAKCQQKSYFSFNLKGGIYMKNFLILLTVALAFMLMNCTENTPLDTSNPLENAKEDSLKNVVENANVTEEDSTEAETLVQNSNTEVTNAVNKFMSDSIESMDDIDMQTAYDNFVDAAEKDPTNTDAQFGAAVLSMAVLQNDPDVKAAIDSIESWSKTTNAFNSMDESEIMSKKATFLAKKLSDNTVNAPEIHELQLIIENSILQAVNLSIARLNIVNSNEDFEFLVTYEDDNVTDTAEIDLGEVRAFLGSMKILKAMLHMIICYDLDIDKNGSYAVFEEDTTAVNQLVALLDPSSSFLAVKTGYLSHLNNIPSLIVDGLDIFKSAITYVKAETDNQENDILKIGNCSDCMKSDEADSVVKYLDSAKYYLTNTVTLDLEQAFPGNSSLEGESIKVNISKLFNIPDFKDLAPYYGFYPIEMWSDTVATEIDTYGDYADTSAILRGPIYLTNASGDTTITSFEQGPTDEDLEMHEIIVFKDPTFNGIFPDMTNKKLFELVMKIDGSESTEIASESTAKRANPLYILGKLIK